MFFFFPRKKRRKPNGPGPESTNTMGKIVLRFSDYSLKPWKGLAESDATAVGKAAERDGMLLPGTVFVKTQNSIMSQNAIPRTRKPVGNAENSLTGIIAEGQDAFGQYTGNFLTSWFFPTHRSTDAPFLRPRLEGSHEVLRRAEFGDHVFNRE